MERSVPLLNRLALYSPLARRARTGLAAYLDLARQRRALSSLDAARLDDLGLSPDAARAEADRPVWDVPDHWMK